MMCLVLRFKACTVCKTVGAVDLDFILSSNREMPTKSKACRVCNSLYVFLAPSLYISLNHNDLFKQQHVGSQDDRIVKIPR